jgi:hypothetical protein
MNIYIVYMVYIIIYIFFISASPKFNYFITATKFSDFLSKYSSAKNGVVLHLGPLVR